MRLRGPIHFFCKTHSPSSVLVRPLYHLSSAKIFNISTHGHRRYQQQDRSTMIVTTTMKLSPPLLVVIQALTLLGWATAFSGGNPGSTIRPPLALHETKKDLIDMSYKMNPAIGFWDPLGMTDVRFLGNEERSIAWLRHSEIKHGRIAMFAFVGYIAQYYLRFPWALTLDGTPFPPIELTPPEQWDALPIAGKLQIIFFIGFLEIYSELRKGGGSTAGIDQHYFDGGRPGTYPNFSGLPHNVPWDLYDPLKLWREVPRVKKDSYLLVELQNGRLGMIGIFGFLCEHKVTGAVPFLKGSIAHYDGQLMAPFENNILLDPDSFWSRFLDH